MSTGVIYIATGKEFLREAIISATSLKVVHPELPVTVFTDQAVTAPCFDQVVTVERSPEHFDHVRLMGQSPYERTLYLDADTYVCGDITGLFALLDRFELAVAHDWTRNPDYARELLWEYTSKIPESFFQHQAGVVLFRRSPGLTRFFGDWLTYYERDQQLRATSGSSCHVGDQAAFREALWRSEVALWVLPLEYNCNPATRGYLIDPVKIIHARVSGDFPAIAATLNGLSGRRFYFYEYGKLTVRNQEGRRRSLRIIPWHRVWLERLRRKLQAWGRRWEQARERMRS